MAGGRTAVCTTKITTIADTSFSRTKHGYDRPFLAVSLRQYFITVPKRQKGRLFVGCGSLFDLHQLIKQYTIVPTFKYLFRVLGQVVEEMKHTVWSIA
jgi:hypothetical protein